MSAPEKIAWTEGLFIQPQHFQQQDRYFSHLITTQSKLLHLMPWGWLELNIDEDLLAVGKFCLKSGKGILPDGMSFHIKETQNQALTLDIAPEIKEQLIYLALPISGFDGLEIAASDQIAPLARYKIYEQDIYDQAAPHKTPVPIALAKPQFRLILEREERDAYICLPIAKIQRCDGCKIILDEDYIPPCLTYQASPRLTNYMQELLGMLQQRAKTLVTQEEHNYHITPANLSQFLLLQIINEFELLFQHSYQQPVMHPEKIYQLGLRLLGCLVSHITGSRRPPRLPGYQHINLQQSFSALMKALRHALSFVQETLVMQIPLQKEKFGVEVAVIHDKQLLVQGHFILAVHADIPIHNLLSQIPQQIKIGPVEEIRQLINSQLGGISITPLPVVPPEIPFHADYCYFALQTQGTTWQKLQHASGIAIHLSGEFPGLKLELWVIRGGRHGYNTNNI